MNRSPKYRSAAPFVVALGLAASALPYAALGEPVDPAGASAVPGSAQDDTVDTEREDEEIEVMRVVALDLGELPKDATSFSTAIDLERFEGEHKRLEDLLAQTVGVQIRRFGGAGEQAEISIRGFASTQVVVQLDGVTLNGGRGSGVDLSSIPLAQLEAVEVTRGGSSLRAGSGAMGGVVELRTRRPDYPSTLMGVQAGSFGALSTSLYRTQPGRTFDVGLGYTGFKTDGDFEFTRVWTVLPDGQKVPPPTPTAIRINNEHEQHDGHLSLGIDLDNAGYLLAQQNFGYTIRGEPGLVRGAPSVIAGQHEFAEQRMLRSITQLRWERAELALRGVSAEASLSHRLEHSEFTDPQPDQQLDDEFKDMSTALSLRPQWATRGSVADHRIRGELLLRRDAFDASGARPRERFGAALVLRDDIQLFDGILLIAPGGRLDWTDVSGSHLVPSLGVVVTPAPWLRFKGNVDRSFRNPSFEDLYLPDRGFISGNPDLKPERASNYDLGFELLVTSLLGARDIRLAVSAFRSEIENSIIWVSYPRKVRPENSDDATTEGIDISASIGLGPYIALSANHAELRTRFGNGGAPLPGRARNETHARLELGGSGAVKVVGEMQRSGRISVNTSGTSIQPSRTSWNASLALELVQLSRRLGTELSIRRLWLHAAVDNIGDIAIRDSLNFPQPGRNLRIGLEVQW